MKWAKATLSAGLTFVLAVPVAVAQPSNGPEAAALDWGLPVAELPGRLTFQTKFTGPKSGLMLEVDALQKVLAPAEGTLIYAGAITSNQTGFVILHRGGWASLITSPLSWESTQDLAVGSQVSKGQPLAVVRGGRAQIMRQMAWSVRHVGQTALSDELQQWVTSGGGAQSPPIWVDRLLQAPEVNVKDLLGYGTLQLSLGSGVSVEDCSVRFFNMQMACQRAEQQDYLVPIGVFKLEVLSGKFFKSSVIATNYASRMDTIVQRIEKDDKGNYHASGYMVEQSEAFKAARELASGTAKPEKDEQSLAVVQAATLEQSERERQQLLMEEARLKQEEQARQAQERLAREHALQARQREVEAQQLIERARVQALAQEQERQKREAEAQLAMQREAERARQQALAEEQVRLKREAEAREQERLATEARLLAQQREAARREQLEKAEQAERARALAQAQEQARREADALKERERVASELLLQAQQRDAARKEQAERERQQAQAQEQARLRAEQEAQEAARVAASKQQSLAAAAGARRALIMGNDVYKDVPVLQNARADARAMAAMLSRLGFEVATHMDLNERGMKQAIRNFKSTIRGGDEVVVYFAGHGVQLGATNYLLPVDIHGQSEDQVRDEAIPLQRLLDDIQDTKARFALAIIDACRDNPFKSTTRAIGGRGLAATSAATGQMVMFSAGTGQQALDRLGPNDKEPNGLFTRVLLREMDKPGVSIERLVRNVRNEVARLSKSVGHDQVPAVYDQTLGDFYFKP